MSRETLVLVDGSSYLFRAYYALPPLTNSHGLQTGAVYGVMNMLRKLAPQFKTSRIAVVFDSKGKTFRHKMYPEYKANRAKMPEELQEQIKPLHSLIKDFGFPLLCKAGVEADDVIGTLAKKAIGKNLQVIISTGDKDFAQIVSPHISLINTMTNVKLDREAVIEKFGVPPEKIVDMLALMGDNVDNVPGVAKVGPKTAVKWLKQYGSLDNIMQHADEFTGKIGDNLRQSLDFLPLARELVTIAEDIDLDEKVESLVMKPSNDKKVLTAVEKLEFKTWSRELSDDKEADPQDEEKSSSKKASKTASDQHKNTKNASDNAKTAGTHSKGKAASDKASGHSAADHKTRGIKAANGKHYETITTETQLDQWIKKLKGCKHFALDSETTSLHWMQADIVGLSLATAKGEAAYIPLQHDDSETPQLAAELVLKKLQPLLNDSKKFIIGQNLKYDYKVLHRAGITINAPMWDTMLASYVLDSSRRSHSLDAMAKDFLDYQTISYEEVAGKGVKQICFSEVSIDDATQYAAEDADITLQLYDLFNPQLQADKKLKSVFLNIEMPLLKILSDMELYGVMIDPALLHQQSRQLEKRLQSLQKKIFEIAGKEFNINSPKQLQAIMYDKLKLPVLKKTPTGQPATSEAILQKLSADYPLPEKILDYRSASKLKSTYTDRLPQQIDTDSERIHTSYRQAATTTGRLSSTDPNLQNIPIRTEAGRKIRQAFIAPRGYCILAADYSQIELRIMAHFSKDHGLQRAFADDIDIHKATAAEIFDTELKQVSNEMRRRAKAINFGLMYGMSAYGLSQQLNIPRKQAAEFIDTYFSRYPKVQLYMQKVREAAAKEGYVETLCGRRINIPDAKSPRAALRAAAERAAINAPLQGSCADIIKLAMISISNNAQYKKQRVQMIMQVHDELVFEVHKEDVKTVTKLIVQAMEHAVELTIPLKVSVGVGKHWDQAH